MRYQKKAFYKRKAVIVASGLCLLSVLGLAGIYRMESAKNKEDKELVNWEESAPDILGEKEEETDWYAQMETDTADGQESRLEKIEVTALPEAGAVVSESPQEEVAEILKSEVTQASVQNVINLNFQPDMGMLWPVEGNVILDYSMEKTIYFPTLDQYKYNPSISIQGEVGTPVIAVAAGVIDTIVEEDETGLTMTMDLGNGYKAVYGHLADVTLGTGSYVEAGSQIATIAEPTMYYQIEGDNLYFQVLKDGEPVDPLDYIN